MLDDALPTLTRMAELAALVLLPMVAWTVGRRLVRALDTVEYFSLPALARFSFVSGAMTGLLLVTVNLGTAVLSLDAVLATHGPWSGGVEGLFALWLDPRHYSPAALWTRVRDVDLGDAVTVFAGLAVLLAGLVLMGAIRYFGRGAPRALLASVVVWLGGALGAVYVVCASAWALHLLNLWVPVVAFLLYRLHRHHAHRKAS